MSNVEGVGPSAAKALAEQGFKTAEQFAKASAPDIFVVSLTGGARAATLIGPAKDLFAVVSESSKTARDKADRSSFGLSLGCS